MAATAGFEEDYSARLSGGERPGDTLEHLIHKELPDVSRILERMIKEHENSFIEAQKKADRHQAALLGPLTTLHRVSGNIASTFGPEHAVFREDLAILKLDLEDVQALMQSSNGARDSQEDIEGISKLISTVDTHLKDLEAK